MKTTSSIRVLLADDHAMFRDGVKSLFATHPDIIVAGEASNGKELVELTRELRPDLIFTDIKMPLLSGIEATRIIVQKYQPTAVVALSSYHEEHFIIDMMEAGAWGYLLKNASKEEMIEAVLNVHKVPHFFCHETRKKISALNRNLSYNMLDLRRIAFSETEKSIMRLICKEYTTAEISKQLFLSQRTIEGYRIRIMRKTNSQNAAGIVTFAIRYGIYEV